MSTKRQVYSIAGSFGSLFLKLRHHLKTGYCRAKPMKIWALGVYVEGIWVLWAARSLAQKYPWIVQGHLCVIWCTYRKVGLYSKTAHRRVKQTTIWVSGVYVEDVWVLLTLNITRSFWVHLVHFSKIRVWVKSVHCRAKRTIIWILGWMNTSRLLLTATMSIYNYTKIHKSCVSFYGSSVHFSQNPAVIKLL